MSLDHGNVFTTRATIAAYEHGEAWFNDFVQYTQRNRDWILTFMREQLPQVTVFEPEGTNQIWFNFSGLNLDSAALKSVLVDSAKLALTPGLGLESRTKTSIA